MSERAVASPEERLVAVRDIVTEQGAVRIRQLAEDFGVSEMTIRRDLIELEILGHARRVRGGAVAIGSQLFHQRHSHNARAKARIADKLRLLVPSSGILAFDASSTVHRLASTLDCPRDLSIITNGLDTFAVLCEIPGVTSTLTGGTREPRTGSLVGPIAVRVAEMYLYDTFICSASALESNLGSSEASQSESEVKRALGKISKQVILAVDHTKLDTRAQARTFQLDEISLLVTDLDPTDGRLDAYRDLVRIS